MPQKKTWLTRLATDNDSEPLLEMVKALLIDLGDGTENFDEDRFLHDAFGPDPQFRVLVASNPEGELFGYALFHDSYEPAYAARGVYLADLFVKDQARGSGLGKQLIAAVAKDAKDRGRSFIWLVSPKEENQNFYDKTMTVRVDLTAYALTSEDFEAFAASVG